MIFQRAPQAKAKLGNASDAMSAGGDFPLARVCRELRPRLLCIALRVTRSLPEAEDAVQDALTVAWRTRECYTPARGTLYAWLAGIVRHKGIDRVRGSAITKRFLRRAESELAADRYDGPDSLEFFAAEESKSTVRNAMLALSPPEQAVIALSFFDGRSHGEIVAALQLPLGTVKARIRRALQKLRAELRRPAVSRVAASPNRRRAG